MKWEYQSLSLYFSSRVQETAELNRLGEDGWELVCIMEYTASTVYYFKRPIPTIHVVDISDGFEEVVKKVVKKHLSEVAWGRA